MKIDIEYLNIFPTGKIIAGVTKKSLQQFPEYGFSISPANIYDEATIIKNRQILAQQIGYDLDDLIFQKQTHSDIIEKVVPNNNIYNSDGLICNIKNKILNISIADCVAVLIYDPVNEVIAALHSGWRGSSHKISVKAVKILKEKYSSKTGDLIAYISPSASGDLYEVGEDVARHFVRSTVQINNSKFLFDNKSEIELQLFEAGLKIPNIYISDVCTISNPEYHSYRRDKEKSGRMSCFIGMIE